MGVLVLVFVGVFVCLNDKVLVGVFVGVLVIVGGGDVLGAGGSGNRITGTSPPY